MSTQRYARKALFDVFRRGGETVRSASPSTPSPARPSFSLDAFYKQRTERGEATTETIPEVRLREGLAPVETTQVGVDRAPPAHDIASTFGDGSLDTNVNGKVRIRTYACLAWQRSFCTTCSERCPERAIVVEQGKPRVEEDRCTGCGQCVRLCPAPVNGFDIIPNDPETERSDESSSPHREGARAREIT